MGIQLAIDDKTNQVKKQKIIRKEQKISLHFYLLHMLCSMQYSVIHYTLYRVLINTNTNEGVFMSNIKITDVQPANIVDELFTELTDEQLSQVSGGAIFFQDDDTTVSVSGGIVQYSGSNGQKGYFGNGRAFYIEG
jgi:bacteriocin-like protein